jgi:hypothetical protein
VGRGRPSHATLETVAHNLDQLIDQFPMTAIVANRYQDVGRQSDCARTVTRVRARRELPPVRLSGRSIFRCGIELLQMHPAMVPSFCPSLCGTPVVGAEAGDRFLASAVRHERFSRPAL